MKISRNLNLIIPVRTEKGNGWIHATPISKEVFKEHFFILGKTFSAMFSDGLGVLDILQKPGSDILAQLAGFSGLMPR